MKGKPSTEVAELSTQPDVGGGPALRAPIEPHLNVQSRIVSREALFAAQLIANGVPERLSEPGILRLEVCGPSEECDGFRPRILSL